MADRAGFFGREGDLAGSGPAGEEEAVEVVVAENGEEREGAEEVGGRKPRGEVGSDFRIGGAVDEDVFAAGEADAEDGALAGADAGFVDPMGRTAGAVGEDERVVERGVGEEEELGGVESAPQAVEG